jgi:hypothetical protein
MSGLFLRAEVYAGSHLRDAAMDAEQLATRTGVSVEFVFNDTKVFVRPGESYMDVVDRWQERYEAGREALAAHSS